MPSENQITRRSPLIWLIELSVMLLFVCQAALRLGDTFLGHDQSWYLIAAERLLDGAKLYGPMIRETNPPFVVWFSTLPILLSRWTHLLPSESFYLIILAIILACLLWNFRLLRAGFGQTVPVFPALFAGAVLFVEFHLDAYDFGQREQLVVVLMLPYILATTSGVVSRLGLAERLALGFAAAVATCFKPHYALVIVALEVALALRDRTLRRIVSPELICLIVTCFFYLVLVRLITPQYGKETVPILFDTYWAYGTQTLTRLLFLEKRIIAGDIFVLLAAFLLRRYLYMPQLTMALIVCSLAGVVAYAVQHTDWVYHQYPHKAFFLLGILCLIIDLFCHVLNKTETSRFFTVGAAWGLVSVEVVLVALFLWQRIPIRVQPPNPAFDEFFAQYQPHTNVYILSTNVRFLSNVYYRRMNWSSGYPCLWLLPAIIQNEMGPAGPPVPFRRLSSQTVERLADMQRSEIAHDLNRWQPSIVLVEQCTPKYPCLGLEGKDIDVLAWFRQSPEFSSAWSHYELRSGAPRHFDLYARVP